ncbi:phosphoglycerate mutase-like protein [Amylostereum chailletii]|nr:phosphoglycerate mutase-like protein [Amylostereum chailletii]
MTFFRAFCVLQLGVAPFVSAAALKGSPAPTPAPTAQVAATFVGSTATFAFPPSNFNVTFPDPNFPDKSEVGFAGPTPTGDEALAIQTAPAIASMVNIAPLVRPDTFDHKGSKFDVVKYWGNLSPWYSLPQDTFGLPDASPAIPEGCAINQAHILHRHGARYPTSGSAPASFAARLHTISTGTGFSASGPLTFLNEWTFKLGAEILTPLGREQLYMLGVNARVRYGGLLKAFNELPVWRTTSEGVLQFAAGFFGVQQYQTSYHQLIEVEAGGFNSTLAPYDDCTNANSQVAAIGGTVSNEWAAKYTVPTIKRLQKYIRGVNFTTTDVIAMQQLCAYESVALGYSSFCDLFTEEEWESYEYYNDLSFWYSNGPGNPAAAAQGVGYVQEFISRLTQTPITTFGTSVNGSIVSNNVTFPLNQPLYVDASHDTVISTIAVALNLTSLAKSGPLPADRIDTDRQWIVSHISPFATNLVAQVLSCPANDRPTHVRWILNDAVVPLTGVRGCKADQNGLCELGAYINGTKARIAEIDYQFDCFANYTVPVPDTITNGQYPASLKNATKA